MSKLIKPLPIIPKKEKQQQLPKLKGGSLEPRHVVLPAQQMPKPPPIRPCMDIHKKVLYSSKINPQKILERMEQIQIQYQLDKEDQLRDRRQDSMLRRQPLPSFGEVDILM